MLGVLVLGVDLTNFLMSDQWSALVLVVGILTLGIMAIVAVISQVDGVLFGLIATAIAALCGWKGKTIRENRKYR